MSMREAMNLVAFLTVSALLLPAASAQSVSEAAQRYLDRGQAAIAMAKTPADLNDAVKEFQKAIDLAPNWPDPYYHLGMVQNKMERFDDAVKNLKSFLQLAPNAAIAQEVKQTINVIEYKKDKEMEVKKAFELLGSTEKICKIVSAQGEKTALDTMFETMGVVERFSFKNGVLGIVNPDWIHATDKSPSYPIWSGFVQGRPEWSFWVPLRINGRSFEYTHVHVVAGQQGREGRMRSGYIVTETRGKGEIITLDPIQTKTTVTKKTLIFVSNDGNGYQEGDFERTSEIVEECRQK